MIVLAVDDESFLLGSIEKSIKKAIPDAEVHALSTRKEVFGYLKQLQEEKLVPDMAFLDMRLEWCNGISLAKELRKTYPSIRIIFCTSYAEFALDAFAVRPDGYLLKPVTAEQIKHVLERVKRNETDIEAQRVKIQTFGNFDVFVDGKLVLFNKGKAKELLAYLVDRKGAGVTAAEVCSVLWDGNESDANLNNNLQHTKKDLKNILNSYGIGDIVIFGWNCLALDVSKVNCDFYNFMAMDLNAVDAFMGEYMKNYDWAEFTTAELIDRKRAYLSKNN